MYFFTIWKNCFKRYQGQDSVWKAYMVVVKLLPGSVPSLTQSFTGTESCTQLPEISACAGSPVQLWCQSSMGWASHHSWWQCLTAVPSSADIWCYDYCLLHVTAKTVSSHSHYCHNCLPACHFSLSFVLVAYTILPIYQWFDLLFIVTITLWQSKSLLPIALFSAYII